MVQRLHSRLFVIGLLLSLFFSCSSDPSSAILLSDIPEIAYCVEVFNETHDEYTIKLTTNFHENYTPDIIVSSYLNSPSFKIDFAPLTKLIENNEINPDNIYKNLLDTGVIGGVQRLFPLSFTLPIIMYTEVNFPIETCRYAITLEQIRQLSHKLSKEHEGNYTKLGFHPLWNPHFAYVTTQLYGTGFHQEKKDSLTWDQEKMDDALSFLKRWYDTSSGSYEKSQRFSDKYMYEPPSKLLLNGKIGLYIQNSVADFFQLPLKQQELLNFCYIEYNKHIAIRENIQYIGIPTASKKKKIAEAFLTWIVNPHIQDTLIFNGLEHYENTFGFLNGFSSNKSVNNTVLTQYYQKLLGHIPQKDNFIFSTPLPRGWDNLRTEILGPWFNKKISPNTEAQDLDNLITSWFLQH